jgi:hypothetical protein
VDAPARGILLRVEKALKADRAASQVEIVELTVDLHRSPGGDHRPLADSRFLIAADRRALAGARAGDGFQLPVRKFVGEVGRRRYFQRRPVPRRSFGGRHRHPAYAGRCARHLRQFGR